MILVTTGMLRFGFDRLVRGVDELVKQKKIKEKVFIQTGFSKYKPVYCKYNSVVPLEEMEQLMSDCSILITQGGAGLIADGLERNKPIIAVPRRKKYHEHVNDHQLDLTSVLVKEGRIIVVNEIENLPEAINKVNNFNINSKHLECKIYDIVKDYLDSLSWGEKIK